MSKYIDTHSHLNFEAFKGDVGQVVKRSLDGGIGKIIVVGTNIETSERAVELAEKYDHIYASVGIHPYHCLQAPKNFREELEVLAESEKVVAIGETGLDFFKVKDHSDKNIHETKDKQLEVLRAQLGMAVQLDLPVIIHNRKADEVLIDEIQRYRETERLRGVFHCFDSTWEFAQKVLKNKFYISFTGIITYSNKKHLIEVVKNVPNNKYMLETDSPYLTPEPHKFMRNEPKNVKIIAEKLAELKEISLEKVARDTFKTASRLFKL